MPYNQNVNQEIGEGDFLMQIHLESLSIDSFRGLKNLELDGLSRVNLFVGPNNSGKTSVLEAISTYCRPLDPLEWLNTSRRREAIGGEITPIARLNALRWLFPQTREQHPNDLYHGQVQMQAKGGFAVKSVLAKYQEIRGIPDEDTLKRIQQRMPSREPDLTYQGAELQININAEQKDLSPVGNIQANFVFWESAPFFDRQRRSDPYSLSVRTITPVSHRTERSQIDRFSEATLNRDMENILDLIRLFDPDILGMQILGVGGISLFVDHKKTGLTPLSAFGDGVRRVIMIALTLSNIKDGVLLIDEIETAIHISVLNDVYRWLFDACKKNNIQLFATTHSLEAVDALIKAHPAAYDDLVAYRFGQPGESAKRYGGELLNRLRSERGLDVR